MQLGTLNSTSLNLHFHFHFINVLKEKNCAEQHIFFFNLNFKKDKGMKFFMFFFGNAYVIKILSNYKNEMNFPKIHQLIFK